MQDDEAGKASRAEILASIRDIDAAERAGRAGPDMSGPLQLTAAMRTGGPSGPSSGMPYRALPTGPLGPAPDEEPPLILTRRLDLPPEAEPAFDVEPEPAAFDPPPAWSSRVATSEPAPEPAPAPAFAASPSPVWPSSDAPEPTRAPERPAFDPQTFPAPASEATPPAFAPNPPSFPTSAPSGPAPDLESAPTVAAAPIPAPEPAPRPAAAMPNSQALRRAMSVEEGSGVQPPFPAAGLPRNRDELLAMVRQAIRDELAGPLGERISINIRQLVAREVRRAVEELDAEQRKGPGAS